jgi:hypothetical protein
MTPTTDDEEELSLRLDRRRNANIKDWAVIVTLMLNLGGLVWTAAKWSAAIEQLQISVAETNKTMAIYGMNIQNLNTEQALLKYQVNSNTSKIK